MWNFGGHCFQPWKPIFLAKIHIFIPKCTAGGGSTGLGNIPKKHFFTSSLMDDVGAPSKVRRPMNIESWSVWLVLRSPGWTSSWLCLYKKSHIFMPQVEPEKASLTLYTTISIKILSKFPTSHFCLLLPGDWDLVYLVYTPYHLNATHQNIKQSNSANFPVVRRWQG